ncbi:TIGR04086 family membrane protein [Ruminococcus sp. CAG:330]|uniref:TIGR04086 family membrane protein n=1 Tax=Ruminococcus sp. CAG:330 TaxID=1262954 RepID=UPI000337E09D|nr:TIGR04086 family membrane protein [Ruminococcus sp. CAG:330]CDE11786.1 unknown [Ruminococcus sp. CAG:330]
MQTRRQPPRKNIWETGVWFLLPAVFVGLAILCGMVLLFALLLLKADAPAWMETLLALAALLTAGYGMGRFAGYRRHRKGLRTGLQCGVLLYLLLVLAGVLWLHEAGTLWKGLVLMLSSATGGVAGVNLPRKHPPR